MLRVNHFYGDACHQFIIRHRRFGSFDYCVYEYNVYGVTLVFNGSLADCRKFVASAVDGSLTYY